MNYNINILMNISEIDILQIRFQCIKKIVLNRTVNLCTRRTVQNVFKLVVGSFRNVVISAYSFRYFLCADDPSIFAVGFLG